MEGRVIFKMLERTAASRVSAPFLSSLSSSAAALFRFSHRRFVHLSLICVAGSFRSMKFESRSGNLEGEEEGVVSLSCRKWKHKERGAIEI